MGKKINVDGYGEVTVLEALSDSELEKVSGGKYAYVHKCTVCGKSYFAPSKISYCCNQQAQNCGKVFINYC